MSARGEIIQTQRRFDLKLSVPDYYKIIEMKTGGALRRGVRTRRAAQRSRAGGDQRAAHFGLRLGTAYQIYDDVLDLAGDEAKRRQDARQRPAQGQADAARSCTCCRPATTPSASAERDHPQWRRRATSSRSPSGRIAAGAVKTAVATGRKMLREAAAQLEVVPANKYRDALGDLVTTLDGMIGQFARVGRLRGSAAVRLRMATCGSTNCPRRIGRGKSWPRSAPRR